MKIAVIGYGIDGKSAVEYWKHLGDEITVCDQNEDLKLPDYVDSHLGAGYLRGLDQFDVIVRSSGINPSMILAGNPGVEDKITTVINEFLRVCPTKNVIGVTGTKGKGTTSTLITKMLEAAGKEVFLGGNIGNSPLDFLPHLTADSWVVLELSSFQLSDVRYSPHIGVCLMVVPEHLNWHPDMDNYVEAKSHLFSHQKPNDIAIYYADSVESHKVASASPGAKITYFAPPGAYVDNGYFMIDNHKVYKTDELHLLGKHNWQNVCAAITVLWQVSQDIDAIRRVLKKFSGLEHRLEFVHEVNGVTFYNDSFAAGLHATAAAVEAIPGKKVMIVGGYDRGLSLDHFGEFAKEHENVFRCILLIGQSTERLAEILKSRGFTNFIVDSDATDMPEIVKKAYSLAKPGDAVVLSPGFASFDMFKNFVDRGERFKAAVEAL